MFALLGYLHGYKIGYDQAFQSAPIVPVIVLPTVSQHQSVSILKTICDIKFQENENKIQSTLPEKHVLSNTSAINKDYEDIEVFKATTKRDSSESILNNDVTEEPKDALRQADNSVNMIATVNENTTKGTSTTEAQAVSEVSIQLNVTEEVNNTISSNTTETPVNGYSTASYNNEFVTSIQLTTEVEEATGLPPVDDNRWKNFTNDENSMRVTESQPTVPKPIGPYSDALYDNYNINNLVLTTEPYKKDPYLPPVQDERWKNFSSDTLHVNSGQFKPLAGLYYDGFLHKPLQKVGFIPRPNYIF